MENTNLGTPQITDKDVIKLSNAACDCGNYTFDSVIIFKKLSSIMSPVGIEQKIPINVMICKGCGKIPKSLYDPEVYLYFPEELKTE